jgi:hypothetical protein
MKPNDPVAAAEKLKAEIERLHAAADDVIKARIYSIAAQISNVPSNVLKNIFVAQCGSGYCRCRAIRNIAAGNDGL